MENNAYKVTVRKGLGPGNWQDFSKVIFEVSLDNKRFRGDSFYAILDWARTRFKSIHIIICDTLQRHNISFDKKISESKARPCAKQKGDLWLQESQVYFDKLKLTPEITRWDDWLNYDQDLYNKYDKDIRNLYETNQTVQNEINKTCDAVWERRKRHENIDDVLENAFKNQVILPYFFEETVLSAIFLPVIKGVSAYPGSLPKIWNTFIDGKINTLNGFREHTFINLDLKRKS